MTGGVKALMRAALGLNSMRGTRITAPDNTAR